MGITRRPILFDGVIRHGDRPSITAYQTLKCRCPDCCEAMAVRLAKQRERDKARRWDLKVRKEPEPPDWGAVAHLVPGAGVRRGWRRVAT